MPPPELSKYWVEQNNIKELKPSHIGHAIWTNYEKRKKTIKALTESLEEYGELIIIHHKGAKHGEPQFVGESIVDRSCRSYITKGYEELADVLRRIFEEHGVSKKVVDTYLEQVKAHLAERYRGRVSRVIHFVLELKNHKLYENSVKYRTVKDKIQYKPRQGEYLVPITLKDYRVISEAARRRTIISAVKPSRHRVIDLSRFVEVVDKRHGIYDYNILLNVVLGYNSGKHLLLAGPPGVGKSFLAEILAETLQYELIKTTASSTWTRYDFIGGPRIVKGTLKWYSGIFLRALYRHMVLEEEGKGAILLIDELNRCEADKVLSEFFTIYSSSDSSKWVLPDSIVEELSSYNELDEPGKYFLDVWRREGKVKIPWGFRVVATVNTWDIAHLYTLGYALLRRFHIVEIEPPIELEVSKIVEQAKSVISGFGNIDLDRLKHLAEQVEDIASIFRGNGFPLGIAYEVEAVVIAYNYSSTYPSKRLEEAVDYGLTYSLNNALHVEVSKYMLPQKTRESLKKVIDALREKLNSYPRLKDLLSGETIGYT